MKSIGFDDRGDEHLIPDSDPEELHKADDLCGCNPDPFCDEPARHGDYKTPSSWWWSHHTLTDPFWDNPPTR